MSELLSFLEKLNNQFLITLQRRLSVICEKDKFDISANGKMQFSNVEEISNNPGEGGKLITHNLEQIKPINCNVIVRATDTDVLFYC